MLWFVADGEEGPPSSHSLNTHRKLSIHLLDLSPELGELVAALGELDDPHHVVRRRIRIAEYAGPRQPDHAIDLGDALGVEMAEIVPPNAPLSVREHVAPTPPAYRRQRPHLVSHLPARR